MLVPPLLTLLWSHLLPTRPARRPAPHASDTSPGVTPPSGPRLISVCIQPSPWARRPVGPVLAVPCSPALPFSGGDGGATYLRGGGFLPSRKCLSASSSPTPSNGYTFTLFRRHPCRHGRPSIRLQTIHMHYCERLVPFPAHDNSSSIQHLGDEGRADHGNCSFVPRVLSSVMSWIHTSSPAWYSRLWTLPS